MKILKSNLKGIIGFIIGVIIASSIAVYAYSCAAKDVSYTKPGTNQEISVETALNDLYSKSNKTAQQVATLTTQGASYTFQNDGYILGTVTGVGTVGQGEVYYDGVMRAVAVGAGQTINYSLYVPAGTTVSTRTPYGTYNLTCYEFK